MTKPLTAGPTPVPTLPAHRLLPRCVKKYGVAVILVITVALGGCATLESGWHQPLHVQPLAGGKVANQVVCTLQNDRGNWSITPGGGAVTLRKSKRPLWIRCQNPHTGERAIKLVRAQQDGYAWRWRNFLFDFCLATCLVDYATGTIYTYPRDVTVSMPNAWFEQALILPVPANLKQRRP